MKTKKLLAGGVLGLMLVAAYGHPAPADSRQITEQALLQKTLSPYFFVEGADPTLDQLPLKDTSVEFEISGMIADVTVKQTYMNQGTQPLHAQYVFPGSTRAAVHGMKMKVGDKVIVAKIKEREQAKKEFEQAKKEGKSASLLEQQRPNVFTMNVANILPNDRVEVELHYTELLVPESGVYEFVYPTVVGPRYSNKPGEKAADTDKFVAAPYTHEGVLPTNTFGLHGKISSGVPVRELASPSHRISATPQASITTVALDRSDNLGGNRDFILRYRLMGDQITSGLSLYQGPDENFFMLQVQPPKRVPTELIPPREYVFIVDVSGSMFGFPLDISKELLRNLIGSLSEKDRFNVLLFSGDSHLMAPRAVAANATNIAKAIDLISNQHGGGGTELLPAIERVMSLPSDSGMARSYVAITDGYIEEERGVFQYIRNHLDHANVFAFGIGTSVNRHLIEGVAKAGLGEPIIITRPDEAQAAAGKFREFITAPVLTNIQVQYDDFEVSDVEPRIIPTMFAERPVIVHGKWRGKPKGTITVTGRTGQGQFVEHIDVAKAVPQKENRVLTYLWARTKIANLSDLAGQYKEESSTKEITALGLKYSLLTEFTSFIAVHDEVRATPGTGTDVDQPLAMPEGVSDESMGVGAEPGLTLMIGMMMMVLVAFYLARRRQSERA